MQLIADILSFYDRKDMLSEQLQSPTMDWDAMVIIASKHLMLPAVYCRLKDKNLLHLVPEDLKMYLDEITQINRNRNKVLLKEAREISTLFEQHTIEHVFIKGAALIAREAFGDLAERMIGDLDILVAPEDIQKAFDLLTAQGYTNTVEFNYEQKNYRHLARQVSDQKMGAVELHSEILINKYNHLLPGTKVLKSRKKHNHVYVPCVEASIKTAIYGLHINDKAHYLGYISFKTIYDCLCLQLYNSQLLLSSLENQKHSLTFLKVSSVFFKEIEPRNTSIHSQFLRRYFIFCTHHPKLGHLFYTLLNNLQQTKERAELFTNNKSYRSHVMRNKLLGSKFKLTKSSDEGFVI